MSHLLIWLIKGYQLILSPFFWAAMPLLPYLLTICSRGDSKAWCFARQLLYGPPIVSLSPVVWGWTWSSTLIPSF